MNLAIILVISLVCLTSKVYAINVPDWGTNIDYFVTRGVVYNWTSSTAYNEVTSTYVEVATSLDADDGPIYALTTESNVTTASNGISVVYFLNQYLDPNYLYNVTTYVCADFNLNNGATGLSYPFARVDSGYPGVLTNIPQYSYTTSSALNTNVFYVATKTFTACRQYTTLIQPSNRSSWLDLHFTSSTSVTGKYYILGFNIEPLGIATNAIESIIQNSGLASASSVEEVQNSVEQVQAEMEEVNSSIDEQTQQDKEQHEELMNSDISEEDKELPDDSKYQDYTDTENSLKDKVNEADMSVISIGIDSNSSSFVWDTLTRLIQSHSVIFGMFIAILSIGIIKLALGR